MRRLLIASLVALSPFYLGVDKACVSVPADDSLVNRGTIEVRGALQDEDGQLVDGQVQLSVNGVAQPWVNTTDGLYVYPSVTARPGTNLLDGITRRTVRGMQVSGTIQRSRFERRDDLVDRGEQRVFLDLDGPPFHARVREIISQTVDTPLSLDQMNALVVQAEDQIRLRFRETFEERGLRIRLVAAAGTDVTTIFFDGVPNEDTALGRAPIDFLNSNKQQRGNVFVARFKQIFVDDGRLLTETPARRTDSPSQRAIDVGNVLSATAIHELGHTLGLVREGDQGLNGCDGSHNCVAFDQANGTNRALDIHFMTTRRTTKSHFGSLDRDVRMPFKVDFNSFNRSYLEIIH